MIGVKLHMNVIDSNQALYGFDADIYLKAVTY